MKTSRIFMVMMLACSVLACHEEETFPGKGEVQLQFNVAASAQNPFGRVQLIPDGAKIRFSMEDESGNQVYSLKEISLLKLGLDYVTEPLELQVKRYRVTDFFIVNDEGDVLFAIPREGSSLARLVRYPLPVAFNIEKGKLVNIEAQVVRVGEDNTAGDFGYASFSVEEAAYPEFSVSVLTAVNGNLKHTTSGLYLIQEDDTIFNRNLPASMTDIIFKGKPDDVYTLVATKDDYSRYIKIFQLQALKDSLQGRPLQIILEPAFNFIVDPFSQSHYGSSILLKIEGVAGSEIHVDWGDGQSETFVLKEEMEWDEFQMHEYNDPWQEPDIAIDYFISITGDLHDIRSVAFGADWDRNPKVMSLKQLPGLKKFTMGFNGYVHEIDFSGNPELEAIIVGFSAVRYLNISKNRKLNYLHLEYLDVTTAEVDRLIHDLHLVVTNNNVRDGELLMTSPLADGHFPGPPSLSSQQKLDDLYYTYNWEVSPYF